MTPAGSSESAPATGGGTSSPPSLAEIRHALEVLLASYDPACSLVADAEEAVGHFTAIERLGGVGKALAAHRVAGVRQVRGDGPGSAVTWLAGVTGESPAQARGTLQLGGRLGDHPAVEEAARKGAISPARAALVAEASEADPASEGELVEAATSESHTSLKERCARARARGRSREDETARHRRRLGLRRLHSWTDDEGMCRLEAALTPEDGAELLARLERRAERFFTAARTEGRRDPRTAHLADALVALVCGEPGGTPVRPAPGGDPEAPGTTTDPPAGTTTDPPANVVCGPRATVELRLSVESLRRGSVGSDEVCELDGVGPVSLATARDLLGDAIVQLLLTDGADIRWVSSRKRTIPAAVRAALLARDDRRCVVPGCGARWSLEIDHWRVAFADDGPTELDNLALLCRSHHRQKTYRGFRLEGGPGAWAWLSPARGTDSPATPHPQVPDGTATPPGEGETPLFRQE